MSNPPDASRPAPEGDALPPSDAPEVDVATLIAQGVDGPALADAVGRQHAADAADSLETLEEEAAADVLNRMEDQAAADALAEMERPLATGVLEELIEDEPAYLAHLLGLMAPDDAADLLQVVEPADRDRLVGRMDRETAIDVVALLHYGEETAGGMMTTDYLALTDDMTVQSATEFIRSTDVSMSTHHALVVDADGRLVGVLGLRELLLARPRERIGDLMSRDVVTVRPDVDREEVARAFDRYHHAMLPVTDDANRLLGVVEFDDVIHIIREEQTEDVQKTVGAGKGEAVYSSVGEKIRGRSLWLVISLAISLPAAFVILQFEPLIAEAAFLAVLMPVIAAVSGNAGHQALAVTLRGIVLDQVRRDRVWPLIVREGIVGLLNGFLIALSIAGIVALLSIAIDTASWRIGLIGAAAMWVSMTVGTFTGSLVPLLMRRFGFDPAQASAIFLIMITDSVSFTTLLGFAYTARVWIGAP
ncbi:MAG: magnesium transporter [Phycisphaerales bacterium]|nr:magnesium transporter [Phycisphaerales bacterium]